MPVPFNETNGSPTFSYDQGKFTVTRTGYVAWEDKDAFATELMPPTIVAGNSIINSLGAALPGNPQLRVMHFTGEPMFGESAGQLGPDSNGIASYELCKFTIVYAIPMVEQQQNNDPANYLTHTINGGGQMLTFSSPGWTWQAIAGTDRLVPDDIPVGLFVPTTQHTVMWPKVPVPPWYALERLKGTINNSPFSLRGFPYATETLLYLNYSAKKDFMSNGVSAWEITMNFEGKYVPAADEGEDIGDDGDEELIGPYGGHNHYYKANDSTPPSTPPKIGWYRIKKPDDTDPNTNSVYRRSNFNLLFKSG